MGGGFSAKMELAGYMKGKNLLGMALATLFLMYSFLILEESRYEKLDIFLLFLLFLLLLLTFSKTNIALVLICFVGLRINRFNAKLLCVMTVTILVSVFVFFPGIFYVAGDPADVSMLVSDGFLTGRGIIWSNLYYDLYYFKKAILGYGYGAFFAVGEVPLFFDDKYSFLRYISSAHNGYLELFIQFGYLLGTFLFVYSVFPALYSKKTCFLVLIGFVYLHNITESSFLRDQSLIWMLYIYAVVMIFYEKNEGVYTR